MNENDENKAYNDDENDNWLPPPHTRSALWDYAAILVGGTLAGLLTQWVMESVAANFGIGDLGEWAMSLTPQNAAPYGDVLRCITSISSIGNFLMPTLLFVHFFYGLNGFEYLNADRLPRRANLQSGLFWLLGALPFLQGCFALNTYLARQMQLPPNTIVESFQAGILHMPTSTHLLLNLLVMAILPAVSEEFWFRGIIQRVLGRGMRNATVGIWLTAVWFSLHHAQADGFVPRLLLGAMLGYLAYWSGSIWTSVAAHFLNNAIPILLVFFYPSLIEQIDTLNTGISTHTFLMLGSMVFVILFGGFLHFINKKNRNEYDQRLILNV